MHVAIVNSSCQVIRVTAVFCAQKHTSITSETELGLLQLLWPIAACRFSNTYLNHCSVLSAQTLCVRAALATGPASRVSGLERGEEHNA
jgi:hypothetical protein